jgi:hypothetical protein
MLGGESGSVRIALYGGAVESRGYGGCTRGLYRGGCTTRRGTGRFREQGYAVGVHPPSGIYASGIYASEIHARRINASRIDAGRIYAVSSTPPYDTPATTIHAHSPSAATLPPVRARVGRCTALPRPNRAAARSSSWM